MSFGIGSLSIVVAPANQNDSTLYIPTLKNFKIRRPRGRSIKVDWEEFKKKSAIERFFSWIESYKKVFPRYEIKEISYLGVVMFAAIMRLNQVLG